MRACRLSWQVGSKLQPVVVVVVVGGMTKEVHAFTEVSMYEID